MFNWQAIFVAALIPLSMGMIWFSPKVFGNKWYNEIRMDIEKLQGRSRGMLMLIIFLFSLPMAFVMNPLVIHQLGAYSVMDAKIENGTPEQVEVAKKDKDHFTQYYGDDFRTFKHGALHGFMLSLFLVLPIIVINARNQFRSWKYIFITSGYWSLCMLLMGGIICGWT